MKQMNNYILEYYQGIENGGIVVGKWVRLLYEKIVENIDSGVYVFDQHEANRAIMFIENFCHHNKGDLAPGLLKLSLWQKAAISCIFGIKDHDGNRQFRECFMVVGRKCGKTLLASAIMAVIAYMDGEYGGEIYCIAPKLEQSDLVYSAFEFNIDHTNSFAKLTQKRGRKQDLYISKTNTFIKKVAFSEKRADGYNPLLTVADEMSSWPGARGLKQYEVMVSGTGARKQPLTLSISSSGYENDGIYDELFKRSTRFLMGESTEGRLLPFLYTIDDVAKWNDLNELRKSLPGLGISVSSRFMLDQIAIAEGSLSKKAEFLTKYCNVKQSSSQAWLDSVAVDTAFTSQPLRLEDFSNSYAVVGIDLSRTTDLTAAICAIQKNGKIYIFSQFWMPSGHVEESTQKDGLPYRQFIQNGWLKESGDNFVDYHDVYKWCTDLIERYQIYPLKVGYDRYSAQYLVQDLNSYGFQMDDVYQGENLTPVIREFEGILNDGNIVCSENDLLKVHMLNSAAKINSESERMKLVKLSQYQHIDGMAAMLDAFCVRQKWWSEIGEQLKNE